MSKKLLISVLALTAVFAVAIMPALAESDHNGPGDNDHMASSSQMRDMGMQFKGEPIGQVGLTINPSGEVAIKGAKVISVSGSTVMVTSFGISLNVNISGANMSGTASSTGTFNSGDMVSVKGKIDPATGIVAATAIRNESVNQAAISAIQQQIQALQEQLRKLLDQARSLVH